MTSYLVLAVAPTAQDWVTGEVGRSTRLEARDGEQLGSENATAARSTPAHRSVLAARNDPAHRTSNVLIEGRDDPF